VSDPGGVIVTGGTGALGRALVSLLVERGSRVAVPWRHEKGWKELESSLGRPSGLVGRRADLDQEAGTRAFVEWAVGELGTLEGMALTAGGWAGGSRFEEAPEEQWDSMLATNLATVSGLCRLALPHLLEGGGSVVTVGARAAELTGDGMAAYAVSKSAVHTLTRVLARENRRRGARQPGGHARRGPLGVDHTTGHCPRDRLSAVAGGRGRHGGPGPRGWPGLARRDSPDFVAAEVLVNHPGHGQSPATRALSV
jgi:NAD(P)-dependent dehydrogenase (short-subunit alcohol dehydrogenase family)